MELASTLTSLTSVSTGSPGSWTLDPLRCPNAKLLFASTSGLIGTLSLSYDHGATFYNRPCTDSDGNSYPAGASITVTAGLELIVETGGATDIKFLPSSGTGTMRMAKLLVGGGIGNSSSCSSSSSSSSGFTKANFVSDTNGRVITAHGFNYLNELLAVQTWTVDTTAANLTAVSGYEPVQGDQSQVDFDETVASYWYISNISGGKIMWLPCSTDIEEATINGSPGYRLRVGDVLGVPPANARKLESIFPIYGENLGYVTTISASGANGGRLSQPGVIDTLNYRCREIQLIVNYTPGATVTSGALTLEIYRSIDGGSTWPTSASFGTALPCTASTAARFDTTLPPGRYKIDILNQNGSAVTGLSLGVNLVTI